MKGRQGSARRRRRRLLVIVLHEEEKELRVTTVKISEPREG
jgi:hypothetical protein